MIMTILVAIYVPPRSNSNGRRDGLGTGAEVGSVTIRQFERGAPNPAGILAALRGAWRKRGPVHLCE